MWLNLIQILYYIIRLLSLVCCSCGRSFPVWPIPMMSPEPAAAFPSLGLQPPPAPYLLCPPEGQAAPHPGTKCRLLEAGAAAAQGLGYGLVGFFQHRRGSGHLNARETVDCLMLACLRNLSLQTLQLPPISPWAFLGSHHCPGTPHYCSRPAVLQWGSRSLAPHPDHWKVQ